MAESKILPGSASSKFVTIFTGKKSSGKIGSYEVRTIDAGRFKSAVRAAGTTLRSSETALKPK